MVEFLISTESDCEALRDAAVKAFEEDRIRYGFMPPGIETLIWHLSKVNKGMYYKIVKGNKIIGGINLYNLGDGKIRLGALFIEPAFQNSGIGAKAIDFVENKYKEYKKWSLDTPYKNYRNQRFYEKHGYVKVGETKPMDQYDFWLFEYEKNIV